MKYVIGYEDVLMASVKALAENESDKGKLPSSGIICNGNHFEGLFVRQTTGSFIVDHVD